MVTGSPESKHQAFRAGILEVPGTISSLSAVHNWASLFSQRPLLLFHNAKTWKSHSKVILDWRTSPQFPRKLTWIGVRTLQKVLKICLLKAGSPCSKKPGALPSLLFPEKTGRKLQILHKSSKLSAYLCLSSRPWPHIPFDYPGLCLIKGKEPGQGGPRIDSGGLKENFWPCLCKSAENNREKQQLHNHQEKGASRYQNLCESPVQTWFRGPIMILLSPEHF